jgi:hypothetical protein
MLSLENDVGPFLATCVVTQYHGLIHIEFRGDKGIVAITDEREMRRPEEVQLRMRHMRGSQPREKTA